MVYYFIIQQYMIYVKYSAKKGLLSHATIDKSQKYYANQNLVNQKSEIVNQKPYKLKKKPENLDKQNMVSYMKFVEFKNQQIHRVLSTFCTLLF